MKVVVGFFGLLGIIAIGLLYYTFHNAEPASHFRMAPVVRGDLSWTISATGTVEPEEVVDVGAQVTGKIASFGPDPRGKTDPRFKGKPIDFSFSGGRGRLVGEDRRRPVQGPVRPGRGGPGARQGRPRRVDCPSRSGEAGV